MRPLFKTYAPTAVDTDGIVDGATGATSPLSLNGVAGGASANDGLAHQLNLTSAANISAITFTITGTDADGVALTEAIAGPNATTVETTGYFKTVTSIAISATLGANTVDIGWVDEFVTPTIQLNTYAQGVSGNIDVTGTIDYTVQATNSDIRTRADDGEFNWFDVVDATIDLIDITADVQFGLGPIPSGLRLKANSYSSSATAALRLVHQNNL
jgi:hypothetical protein